MRSVVSLFLAGAALLVISDAPHSTVSVDEQSVRDDFVARHDRQPTAAELASSLAIHTEDERLYQQGLALGLDRGDPVVRRRIVQKMRKLTKAAETAPIEVAATIAFTHVFHGTDPDGPARPWVGDTSVVAPTGRIAADFGPVFARTIAGLEPGDSAVVQSAFGWHRVTRE